MISIETVLLDQKLECISVVEGHQSIPWTVWNNNNFLHCFTANSHREWVPYQGSLRFVKKPNRWTTCLQNASEVCEKWQVGPNLSRWYPSRTTRQWSSAIYASSRSIVFQWRKLTLGEFLNADFHVSCRYSEVDVSRTPSTLSSIHPRQDSMLVICGSSYAPIEAVAGQIEGVFDLSSTPLATDVLINNSLNWWLIAIQWELGISCPDDWDWAISVLHFEFWQQTPRLGQGRINEGRNILCLANLWWPSNVKALKFTCPAFIYLSNLSTWLSSLSTTSCQACFRWTQKSRAPPLALDRITRSCYSLPALDRRRRRHVIARQHSSSSQSVSDSVSGGAWWWWRWRKCQLISSIGE